MNTPIIASPYSFEPQGIVRVGAVPHRVQQAAGRTDGVVSGMVARLAGGVANVSASLQKHYRAWAQARRQEQEDQRTWELALQDARMMADLSRAMSAAARQR